MRIPTIKKDILRRFQKAATGIQSDSEKIITNSFNQFYAQGSPVKYVRSGELPAAKKIEASIGETEATIKAGYEGGQLEYPTPRFFWEDGRVSGGSFSGQQVLDATMSGSYGVLGDSSYDEQALEKVIQAAEKRMSAAFG